MDAKLAEKISLTGPMNFRPGPALAQKMADLAREVTVRGGRITPTEIVRDGLLGCWPQVRSHLLVRHTAPPALAEPLARLLAIVAKDLELGVPAATIEGRLLDLLTAHLSQSTHPSGAVEPTAPAPDPLSTPV